jgi:hypothetical protein
LINGLPWLVVPDYTAARFAGTHSAAKRWKDGKNGFKLIVRVNKTGILRFAKPLKNTV